MDNEKYFKLHYRGSIGWLIFWIIVFFPIAIALLLTAISFKTHQKTYNIDYAGSRFWLGFWVLVFFPVAFILLFVNGLSLSVHQTNIDRSTARPEEDIEVISTPIEK